MGLYKKLIEWKSRVYDKILTNPKVVRFSTYMSIITFVSAIIIGFIVAQFDPDGYNIVDNWISDMGSFNHTPLPYFLDYGAMISSILTIPAIFYTEKALAPKPELKDGQVVFSRMRYRLGGMGFFFMLMGFFGFFGIGLFSEDRTTILGLHMFFSYVVFSGLVFTGMFYGLLIVFYKTPIPRIMGVYMFFGPFLAGILILNYFTPLFEWILLFSILIWIIPTFLILIKEMESS
ncbi:MAG: hypothetical protein GF383_16355 [Candidatus Lokiarchaeota archaeon]|nr:hypothetical protein [Candidatus Lokiarchaeota archaeon]MBD3343333.1 hypothetical protein [Candidatus Lokiarchaeota archaeon]